MNQLKNRTHFLCLFCALLLLLTSCATGKVISFNDKPIRAKNLNKGIWGRYNFEKVISSKPYKDVDIHQERLTFDLFKPYELKNENLPLIVFVHSGAFLMGNKRNYIITKYCQDFCRAGYATTAINYRILDTKVWDDVENAKALVDKSYTRKKIMEAVGDVRTALTYFHENSDNLGIDPDNIFLVGFSAGGILSSHFIFTKANEAEEYLKEGEGIITRLFGGNEIDNIQGFEKKPLSLVKGVISISGGVMDHNVIEDLEVIKMPFLMIHGTADRVFPFGYDNPMREFVGDGNIDLPGYYFELGVKMKDDNEAVEDLVSGTDITIRTGSGFHVPDWMLEGMIKSFTTEVCGSGCVFDRLINSSMVELIEINEAPHSFMLNRDGRFNKTYLETRDHMYSFINKHQEN